MLEYTRVEYRRAALLEYTRVEYRRAALLVYTTVEYSRAALLEYTTVEYSRAALLEYTRVEYRRAPSLHSIHHGWKGLCTPHTALGTGSRQDCCTLLYINVHSRVQNLLYGCVQ